MRPKRRQHDIRKDNAKLSAMGVTVTETVVWSRGKARAFAFDEVENGAADQWVESRKKVKDADA